MELLHATPFFCTFAAAEAGSTAVPARGGRKVRATQSAVLLNGKMAARS